MKGPPGIAGAFTFQARELGATMRGRLLATAPARCYNQPSKAMNCSKHIPEDVISMSDYAIIEAGGKQVRVSAGQTITTDIVPGLNIGDAVTFDRVLLIRAGDRVQVGAPYVKGCKVEAEVEKLGRARKVLVFKYKPKKRYRRKTGHRQPFMVARIKEICA